MKHCSLQLEYPAKPLATKTPYGNAHCSQELQTWTHSQAALAAWPMTTLRRTCLHMRTHKVDEPALTPLNVTCGCSTSCPPTISQTQDNHNRLHSIDTGCSHADIEYRSPGAGQQSHCVNSCNHTMAQNTCRKEPQKATCDEHCACCIVAHNNHLLRAEPWSQTG